MGGKKISMKTFEHQFNLPKESEKGFAQSVLMVEDSSLFGLLRIGLPDVANKNTHGAWDILVFK